jgi:hypothetical protein
MPMGKPVVDDKMPLDPEIAGRKMQHPPDFSVILDR